MPAVDCWGAAGMISQVSQTGEDLLGGKLNGQGPLGIPESSWPCICSSHRSGLPTPPKFGNRGLVKDR